MAAAQKLQGRDRSCRLSTFHPAQAHAISPFWVGNADERTLGSLVKSGMCSGALRILVLLFCLRCGLSRVHGSEASSRTGPAVTPQLISLFDQAILLAPDGALWAWGGTESRMVATFGKPTTTPTPIRVGADRNWQQVAAGDSQVFG